MAKGKGIERIKGRELWDYQVQTRIYAGSVSTVCRALAPDQSAVAIKFLNPEQPNYAYAQTLFRREAELLSRMSHPRLLKFIDYYPEPYQPAIVMEYFDPMNLKQRIQKKDPILHQRAIGIMKTVLEALAYFHEEVRYVHRDIKPENVLIDGRGEASLEDFTIAEPIKHFSLFRRIAGSPTYIAPETIQRKAPLVQTDIYSAGVTFYELLTFRPPFAAADVQQLLRMHLQNSPPSPRQHNPKLNPQLERLVLQMMAKKPEERPESCKAVLAQLARIPSVLSN